jgi:hypothetical protein
LLRGHPVTALVPDDVVSPGEYRPPDLKSLQRRPTIRTLKKSAPRQSLDAVRKKSRKPPPDAIN